MDPVVMPEALAQGSQAAGLTLGVAEELATQLSVATGTAISPIFAVAVLGAWFHLVDGNPRGLLLANPWLYGPMLALLVLILAKDALSTVVPPVKKPLDLAEHLTQQLGAVVGLVVVLDHAQAAGAPMVAWAGPAPEVLTAGLGADALPMLLAGTTYGVVWTTGQLFQLLIWLSPWGLVDTGLRAARAGVVLGILGVAAVFPWVGLVICGLILLASLLLFRWSVRWMRFLGWLAWTTLSRPVGDLGPAFDAGLDVAVGAGLRGIPNRLLVQLRRTADGLEVRQLSLFGDEWIVPLDRDGLVVRDGDVLCDLAGPDGRTLVTLPTWARGQGEAVAAALGGLPVREGHLRRGWRGLVGLVRGSGPVTAG